MTLKKRTPSGEKRKCKGPEARVPGSAKGPQSPERPVQSEQKGG